MADAEKKRAMQKSANGGNVVSPLKKLRYRSNRSDSSEGEGEGEGEGDDEDEE